MLVFCVSAANVIYSPARGCICICNFVKLNWLVPTARILTYVKQNFVNKCRNGGVFCFTYFMQC